MRRGMLFSFHEDSDVGRMKGVHSKKVKIWIVRDPQLLGDLCNGNLCKSRRVES